MTQPYMLLWRVCSIESTKEVIVSIASMPGACLTHALPLSRFYAWGMSDPCTPIVSQNFALIRVQFYHELGLYGQDNPYR